MGTGLLAGGAGMLAGVAAYDMFEVRLLLGTADWMEADRVAVVEPRRQ